MSSATELVERYLRSVVEHDWETFASCVSEDVVRVGPFGDTYTPKAPYVEYISELMPSFGGYSMQVDRIVAAGEGVLALLTETLEIGGTVHVTPEAIVFGLDVDGLISTIDIYIKRLA
jgi:predicted ester cyclase